MNYHHQQDVVYGYKDGMGLIMDVLTPSKKCNRAAVIWILSGSMRSNLGFDNPSRGTLSENLINAFKQSAHCLLDAGYVVFAVAHSSTPKYRCDEVIPDSSRAVRFIRYHAERFGIDPQCIGIISDASGTIPSLMVATAPFAPGGEDPVDRESSQVQAVVVHCPGTDLLNFGDQNTTPTEFWGKPHPFSDFHYWDEEAQRFERILDREKMRELLCQCSPITHVSATTPPTLLLHGEEDQAIPLQQSELFAARLQELGVPHKLMSSAPGFSWTH